MRTLVSTGLTDTASTLTSRSRGLGLGLAISTSTSASLSWIGSERWKPTAFMTPPLVRGRPSLDSAGPSVPAPGSRRLGLQSGFGELLEAADVVDGSVAELLQGVPR